MSFPTSARERYSKRGIMNHSVSRSGPGRDFSGHQPRTPGTEPVTGRLPTSVWAFSTRHRVLTQSAFKTYYAQGPAEGDSARGGCGAGPKAGPRIGRRTTTEYPEECQPRSRISDTWRPNQMTLAAGQLGPGRQRRPGRSPLCGIKGAQRASRPGSDSPRIAKLKTNTTASRHSKVRPWCWRAVLHFRLYPQK
jgi:hypothetical protein